MLTPPMTTINQYSSETDDVFIHESLSQSPSDGFVGLPPPPPPPPVPPVFDSVPTVNTCQTLLPHQEVSLVVNRANLSEIQARSIPSMLTASSNIWTRCILPNLRIKQTVFDQHFGEPKSSAIGRYRRVSVSTSPIGGGGIGGTNDDGLLSFVLLDATSKMLYDVPMRHLLQLVKKDYDDDAGINHVIRAIDETHMKSEWLDAVTALNKQFDKRPEDKARVLAHKGSTHGLVLTEQFFVKLVRVPAYEFKLIYLKFREEAPAQLERMSKHINDLLESIETILTNEQLPGILHLLCLLYNSITGKSIPGLHFDSLLSVLSTRTLKQNTTIAHLLCQALEEQYPTLLNIFDNQIFVKLKDLSAIKYIPIFLDVRLFYTRYKQLNMSLDQLDTELICVPEHIKTTLAGLQMLFTKLFDDENRIKQGEKDLATYFCLRDLSLETCLSTLGQFSDKLRLSHMQNLEQRRRNQLLTRQQRTLQTPTRSLRNLHMSCSSETNIFRDHLNVPLTPICSRQRYKVNRMTRDRFCSSRDVANDDQHEQIIQNLLPYTVPRKRIHSPTAKIGLTKRPFNILEPCLPNKQLQEECLSVQGTVTSDHESDDASMDCSTAESSIVPTPSAISACESQSTAYVTTPNRHFADFSNDQFISNGNTIATVKCDRHSPIHGNEFEQRQGVNKENELGVQSSSEQCSSPKIVDEPALSESTSANLNDRIRLASRTSLLLSDCDVSTEEPDNEISQSTVQPILLDYRSLDQQKYEDTKPTLQSFKPSADREKNKTPSKRTSFIKQLRSSSTHNAPSRNILRCAVSRRVSAEQAIEEIHASSSPTNNRQTFLIKSKKPSSPAQPLRAVHMSTFTTIDAPKTTRTLTCPPSQHHLPMQKTFTNRTVSTPVLLLSTTLKKRLTVD